MQVETQEWGTLNVADETVIHFPEGLVGFEDLRRFILVDTEELRPFAWLLSADDPEIGFAVAEPYYFTAAPYALHLSAGDEAMLDLEEGDSIAVFVIVTIEDEGRRICGNLKGPIVLNTRNRLAKQVVIYGSSAAVRQPILSRRVVPLHSAAAGAPAKP
jgi:flagellar assembly factor FliW